MHGKVENCLRCTIKMSKTKQSGSVPVKYLATRYICLYAMTEEKNSNGWTLEKKLGKTKDNRYCCSLQEIRARNAISWSNQALIKKFF